MQSVLARATGDDLIAIVDPPRAGLREFCLMFLVLFTVPYQREMRKSNSSLSYNACLCDRLTASFSLYYKSTSSISSPDMRAVTQLRNTQAVKRLIYISCSPAAALKNFIDLSRSSSKTLRGAPFVPVKAVPVDMFPHTRHVELAILFERENEVSIACNLFLNYFSVTPFCKQEEGR